jgi:hypothetical protein
VTDLLHQAELFHCRQDPQSEPHLVAQLTSMVDQQASALALEAP